MEKLINFLKGKKTITVGICAIIYGVYANEVEAVLLGLGLLGLRDAMTTEVIKTIITQRKKRTKK